MLLRLPRPVMSTRDSLTNSDSLLASAFESARPGMALVAIGGNFLRVNPALCQIVGYSADQLKKLTFQEITHPDDLAPDLENVERLIRGEISGYEMEKRYFRKDGSIVWIQLNVSVVRGRSGEPICFGAQIQDQTRRKQEETRLTDELMRRALMEEPSGELLNYGPENRLLKVVKVLSHEQSLLRQKVSEAALAKLMAGPPRGVDQKTNALLTQRERKILLLATQGKTSKEIASRLGISPRTVEVHRASVMRKFGAVTLTQLVQRALHTRI
jgi:PAS domain S-box-containing protein